VRERPRKIIETSHAAAYGVCINCSSMFIRLKIGALPSFIRLRSSSRRIGVARPRPPHSGQTCFRDRMDAAPGIHALAVIVFQHMALWLVVVLKWAIPGNLSRPPRATAPRY
jgi:hypothetical protein